MIPLLALASLLAGATYFGLPDAGADEREGEQDDMAPDADVSDGGLLSDLAADAPSALVAALTRTAAEAAPGRTEAAPPQGGAQTPPDIASDAGTVVAASDQDASGLDAATGQQFQSEKDLDRGQAPDAPPPDHDMVRPAHADYGASRSLQGTSAGETMRAGFGDALHGEDGDDLLLGGRGNDHLLGGAGNDLLRAGAGDNLLEGGEGSDLLLGVEIQTDMATGLQSVLAPPGEPSFDRLDGGAGDDVLRMGHGDVGTGGSGVDIFELQANTAPVDVPLPEITDFDPERDRLVLAVPFTEAQIIAAWPDTPEHEAQVTVEDFEDGTGATIFVDGEAVARVTGAHGLDPEFIRLTGTDMIGPDFGQLQSASMDQTLWQGLPEQAVAPAILGRG